jgi:hypothetical protein
MLRSDSIGPHADKAFFFAITQALLDRLARRKKSAREAEGIAQRIAALSSAYPQMLALWEDNLRTLFPEADPAKVHEVATLVVPAEVRAEIAKYKLPHSNKRECWNIHFVLQQHRLKGELRPYPARRDKDARVKWLRKYLPAQLERLKQDGCACNGHTDCPGERELEEFARLSPANLIFAILAHYHGTSERQLKKELLQAKKDVRRFGSKLIGTFPPAVQPPARPRRP